MATLSRHRWLVTDPTWGPMLFGVAPRTPHPGAPLTLVVESLDLKHRLGISRFPEQALTAEPCRRGEASGPSWLHQGLLECSGTPDLHCFAVFQPSSLTFLSFPQILSPRLSTTCSPIVVVPERDPQTSLPSSASCLLCDYEESAQPL